MNTTILKEAPVSLTELLGKINNLSTARTEPILFKTEDQFNQVPDKFAIVNNATNKVASVVSQQYALIQHHDVLRPIIKTLIDSHENANAKLIVKNDGNFADLRVVFPEFHINDGTKDGINLGFRATNSYDTTTSIKYQLFAYRWMCDNGMITGQKNIEGFVRKHVGAFNLNLNIAQLKEQISGHLPILKERIEILIERKWTLEETTNRLKELFGDFDPQQDHGKQKIGLKILEKVKVTVEKSVIRAWDVYNAITDIATHKVNSVGYHDMLQTKANRILVSTN